MNKDIYYEEELAHYGVKGTHWGVRRYQNEDGSYKPGAEGRYYNPVVASVVRDVLSKTSKAEKKAKDLKSKVISIAKGSKSASSAAADQHDGQDENGSGAKAPLTGKAKLLNDIITNSKADKSYSYLGGAGGAAASSSSGSKGSKKSEDGDDFKTSTILSKFESLFKEDENWDEVELSDSDIDELDDLVKKYREWRQGNNSKTKKLKSIDSYVEKYNAWRTNHGKAKHSDMDDEFLMHHGVKGMKWGVRRYQNPDGTLTEEGRRRKKKFQDSTDKAKNFVKAKLGIYDPDDDNPYVSKERRDRRRSEKQAAKDLKNTAEKAQTNIAKKNANFLNSLAEKAQERADKLQKREDGKNAVAGAKSYKDLDKDQQKDIRKAVAKAIAKTAARTAFSVATTKGIEALAKKNGVNYKTPTHVKAAHIFSNAVNIGMDAKKAHDEIQEIKNRETGKKAVAGSLFNNKKYRNEDGSLNDEGKARKSKGKQYAEDYWNAHDKKDPKYMSDKELQRRINRLNNENQYKNLNKSTVRKGSEKIAKDFVQTAVITALTALAANQVKKAAPKLISKGRKAVEKRIKEQSNKKWLY